MTSSPFANLQYDNTYVPDEEAISAVLFISENFPDTVSHTTPLLGNVISIRKVINHKEMLEDGDELLHIRFECWTYFRGYWWELRVEDGSQFNSDAPYSPDMLMRFATTALIAKSSLVDRDVDYATGDTGWIEADDDGSDVVSISSGRVPDVVVKKYLKHISEDWNDVGNSYLEWEEPKIDDFDPRVLKAINKAIQRYKKANN